MTAWGPWIGLTLTALISAVSLPCIAQEAPRLPAPRPSIVAGEELIGWAQNVGSRFAEAQRVDEPEDVPESVPPEQHAVAAVEAIARAPRPRPEPAPPLVAMVAPEAPPAPPEPTPAPRAPTETAAEYSACLGRLRALGVAFSEETPIDPLGDCHVDRPLDVTSIGSGIAIEPEAIMNCAIAESLALWAANVVVPAARSVLDAKPETILHGSTYVCRPRNNAEGAKLSEHANANAVDVMSIAFADRDPIEIRARDSGEPEGEFQAGIRAGGCAYFTTVLGPGSNAAHATHLHFDLAKRRGGYRLCELGVPVASGAAANAKQE